jgi:hypothetical protein
MRKEDLIGQKFGKLTVISAAPSHKGRAMWVCKCECGNQSTARAGNLKRNKTNSCGCNKGKGKHFSYEEWVEVGKTLRKFRKQQLKLGAGV